MPVPAEVRPVLGDHDIVPLARLDESLTPGAQVALAGRVRLNGRDDLWFQAVGGAHEATVTCSDPAQPANGDTGSVELDRHHVGAGCPCHPGGAAHPFALDPGDLCQRVNAHPRLHLHGHHTALDAHEEIDLATTGTAIGGHEPRPATAEKGESDRLSGCP